MKKFIRFLGGFAFVATVLAGCGSRQTPINQEQGAGKLSIVCTTFPQYNWVTELIGEAAEAFDVTLLVKNSADIHNYQPSAQDMISMKEADLFIYVGGESDAWVADLMNADSSLYDKSVSLVAALGDEALVEELLEGMQHDHEHDHGHGADQAGGTQGAIGSGVGADDIDDEDEEVLDEHVWLSLENAEILCQYISVELCRLAPDYEAVIQDNTIAYTSALHELHEEYLSMVEASADNALIFGDRFPFRYLAEDYDLECYAAFAGCNAEVEASFDTIITLADKVDTLNVPCILVIDGSDKSLAETILSTAKTGNQEILVLDSMQSVSWEDIRQGANYLDIMRANLEVLRKALG